MDYLFQPQDTSCFVVAAANSLIYLDKPVPDLEKAKDLAKCRNGPTICPDQVIVYCKLPMIKTADPKEIYKNGGILIISHPVFNLHAVFVAPIEDSDRVLVVNSWLGPNELSLTHSEISKFVARYKYIRHWVFKERHEKVKLIGELELSTVS